MSTQEQQSGRRHKPEPQQPKQTSQSKAKAEAKAAEDDLYQQMLLFSKKLPSSLDEGL